MFEIGNSLREARLRQGLDFPEIEQATKIRAKYLRALEVEQFDSLPAQTYVKGFLRSYAEYLGLDGQLYVDEYNSRYVTGEDEPPVRAPRARPPSRAHRRVESNLVVGALIGIAVVAALVIGAWKISDSGTTGSPGAVDRPAAPIRPVGAEPDKRPKPTTIEVVVKATTGSCWMEVHENSAAGRQLFQGTLERGRSQRFVAKKLIVTAGRPENLSIRVDGRPTAIPGRISPATLTVGRRGITAAPLPA